MRRSPPKPRVPAPHSSLHPFDYLRFTGRSSALVSLGISTRRRTVGSLDRRQLDHFCSRGLQALHRMSLLGMAWDSSLNAAYKPIGDRFGRDIPPCSSPFASQSPRRARAKARGKVRAPHRLGCNGFCCDQGTHLARTPMINILSICAVPTELEYFFCLLTRFSEIRNLLVSFFLPLTFAFT